MARLSPIDVSSFHTGLAQDLPISPDATTSRVLVTNTALRVVLFAMDAGQELTEHASPRAVTVHQLQGRMQLTVAGRTESLDAGDVVYLAPSDTHALVAETPSRFCLVMVDLEATPAS